MEPLRKNYKKIISLKQAKKMVILLVFVFLFDVLLFPMPVLANDLAEDGDFNIEMEIVNPSQENSLNEENSTFSEPNRLPENDFWQIEWSGNYTITAYNSEIGQCDSSPCITANGFNVCDHGIEDTIAANFLPFGAKVRIPELYGDKVFIVRDKMNKRYPNRVDIWMIEKQDAKQFGVKFAKIEVLK
ncbi:3D domain-containing protein [Patescibacteria group bacterium]|nr:3D domain-containing protein [Patescibacteria group bacterium]MBU4600447.1 3D domain-containing protein [Patescibacteria group bacterium]MCG2698318.1 3D domain-containing protein [Candidatus Parcubacteria bacterium]